MTGPRVIAAPLLLGGISLLLSGCLSSKPKHLFVSNPSPGWSLTYDEPRPGKEVKWEVICSNPGYRMKCIFGPDDQKIGVLPYATYSNGAAPVGSFFQNPHGEAMSQTFLIGLSPTKILPGNQAIIQGRDHQGLSHYYSIRLVQGKPDSTWVVAEAGRTFMFGDNLELLLAKSGWWNLKLKGKGWSIYDFMRRTETPIKGDFKGYPADADVFASEGVLYAGAVKYDMKTWKKSPNAILAATRSGNIKVTAKGFLMRDGTVWPIKDILGEPWVPGSDYTPQYLQDRLIITAPYHFMVLAESRGKPKVVWSLPSDTSKTISAAGEWVVVTQDHPTESDTSPQKMTVRAFKLLPRVSAAETGTANP